MLRTWDLDMRTWDDLRMREGPAEWTEQWSQVPAARLRHDLIWKGLRQLVSRKVIQGWMPLARESGFGHERFWVVTPSQGPPQTYDCEGIEAFLRMAAML